MRWGCVHPELNWSRKSQVEPSGHECEHPMRCLTPMGDSDPPDGLHWAFSLYKSLRFHRENGSFAVFSSLSLELSIILDIYWSEESDTLPDVWGREMSTSMPRKSIKDPLHKGLVTSWQVRNLWLLNNLLYISSHRLWKLKNLCNNINLF